VHLIPDFPIGTFVERKWRITTQQQILDIWQGEENNILAQEALYHRANCNRAARHNKYSAVMEKS